tara:strand:+ start:1399 stop:2478 length:1080 start_codon:yes stop_codon:yes gene_type:complete
MGWLSDTWDNVSGFATNVASSAKDAVVEFSKDPVGHTSSAINAVKDTAEFAIENPGTAWQITQDATWDGLNTGVASLGEVADLGWNYVLNPALSNTVGTDFGDSDIGGFISTNLDEFQQDAYGVLGIENIDPASLSEEGRRLYFIGDAVGQVGGFVATTVLTGGVGGAALGAVRGAGVGRGLVTGAGKVNGWMNPLQSKGAFLVEGAFATHYVHSRMSEEQAEDIETVDEMDAQLRSMEEQYGITTPETADDAVEPQTRDSISAISPYSRDGDGGDLVGNFEMRAEGNNPNSPSPAPDFDTSQDMGLSEAFTYSAMAVFARMLNQNQLAVQLEDMAQGIQDAPETTIASAPATPDRVFG